MTTPRVFSTPLDQETYYLENAKRVWRWVLDYHRDLLTLTEEMRLESIFQLDDNAQALLTRLVMRRGEMFDVKSLSYTEINKPDDALLTLTHQGYISLDPIVSFDTLCDKATKQQLITAIAYHGGSMPPKPASKPTLRLKLSQCLSDHHDRRVSEWGLSAQWVQLNDRALYQRVQLMFFGNLHQDWSEFIITELGHVRYETVTFDVDSRAFQSRQDVDDYLNLQALYDAFKKTPLEPISFALLTHSFATNWVEKRRQRIAFQVAQYFEKQDELETACRYYYSIQGNAANVRYLRLLERLRAPEVVAYEAHLLLNRTRHHETRVLITRVLKRCYRKLHFPLASKPPFIAREVPLVLPQTDTRIERAVVHHLSQQCPSSAIYYVENHLIPALWALLYWEVIYAPIQGAFFHPFQTGPKDLYSDHFFAKRQPYLDDVTQQLRDDHYVDLILERFHTKYGISCPFIYWPALSQSLLETALQCISKRSLIAIFDYLMSDLKHHKKGLPDLIKFLPQQQHFELIEVKGPTDRLQEQQTLWLEYFHQQNISAWVANLSWQI